MWHIPESQYKRGALLLFITSTILLNPFLNRPDRMSICWLIGVLALLLGYGLSDHLVKERRNIAAFLLWFSVGCADLSVVAWHFWPSPPVAIVKAVPLVTLRITPSGFPVSVAPHSTVFLLPIHPNQVFSDATPESNQLHVFDNSCGEEHFWPSQGEIEGGLGKNHEDVRELSISNHSSTTMEAAKVTFPVIYNDSVAAGCLPPRTRTYQYNVVSIPTLDPGKSFEFFAVNQTNRCAWLLPPYLITVKMAGDQAGVQIPLQLEPSNISNFAGTPFGPTSVRWEGIPTKNPGYGIVRTGADCTAGPARTGPAARVGESFGDLPGRLVKAANDIHEFEYGPYTKTLEHHAYSALFKSKFLNRVHILRDECAQHDYHDEELDDVLDQIEKEEQFIQSRVQYPDQMHAQIYPAQLDTIREGLIRLAGKLNKNGIFAR